MSLELKKYLFDNDIFSLWICYDTSNKLWIKVEDLAAIVGSSFINLYTQYIPKEHTTTWMELNNQSSSYSNEYKKRMVWPETACFIDESGIMALFAFISDPFSKRCRQDYNECLERLLEFKTWLLYEIIPHLIKDGFFVTDYNNKINYA